MRRSNNRARWSLVALISLVVMALVSLGMVSIGARSADASGTVCRKFENPSGTLQINQDGLIMTLVIGTYPDVQSPNDNNAVTSFTVDPSSTVKSGSIKVKGGSDYLTYNFGSSPPLHAPAVSSGKWPTISYVEVCWDKPHVPKVGRVEVTKAVVGDGAPSGVVFEISLTPAGGSPIVKSISAGQTVSFENLPPGSYTLSEKNPGSDWTVTYSSTSITVIAGDTAKATVTNTWSPPEPELGRVEVTKAVVGDGAPSGVVFEISLKPQNGSAIVKSISAGQTVSFENLPPGSYTLAETDPGSNWDVMVSSSNIIVEADKTAKATVTNTWSPPEPELGRVEVTKAVVGEGAPSGEEFEISLKPQNGSAIVKSITGAGVVTFEGLEPGVYTLSEKNPGSDWTVTYSSTSITVIAGDTALATVTNTYQQQIVPPALGSVVVTKVVTGAPPATTYQIGLVGPAPATTERWLTITGAGEVTFAALPVGTYTVVEGNLGVNYTVTISPNVVTVTNGGVSRATVTNAYAIVESSPPTTVASSGGNVPPTTVATAGQALPKTGAEGQLATVAMTLLAGGAALAAVSRRRAG